MDFKVHLMFILVTLFFQTPAWDLSQLKASNFGIFT